MRNPVLRTIGLTLLVLASATAAEAVTLKEKFTKTSPLKQGGTVTIENTNGGITVEAWDRAEVQIEAEKQVKAKNQDLAKKVLAEIKFDIKADAGSFRIKTLMPKRDNGFFDWMTGNEANANVTYRVRVPRQVALEVDNSNGGIKLTGTHGKATLSTSNGGFELDRTAGQIRLSTNNGGISVANAAGTVQAHTTNGGIDVQLSQVPDGADLSFESTNGGITLKLPRDIRTSLDAQTTNGRVRSDFDVEGGTPGKRSLAGDINGGGGKLKVHTTNGDVELVGG